MIDVAPLRLRFTPQSHLLPEGAGAEHPLMAALEHSTPAGLLHLAGARGTQGVEGPEFGYWREFALVFLHEICRRGDTLPAEPPTAAPEFLFDHALRAPDFSGAEYVSQKTLGRLWADLGAHALAEAAEAGGLRAWLARVNPALHTVGRVTFHLAENKRDPDHPFAFMATYVEKLSAAQQPVHIPLGRALQTYAGASNQAALKSLLEPVQTAAATSPFIGELVESRRVFAPQAWSPAEAYRFLREVTALEAAGLIVRIPNWWRAGQGNRPKVQVKVGEKAAAGVGLNALLDFQMETTLDGEPLTPAEWKALTAATDGLVLLRGQWVEADSARLKAALDQWKQLKKSGMGDGVDLLTGLRLLAGFRPGGVESAPEAASPDWSQVVAGDWLRERLDALRDPARLRGADPGKHVRATLRPYQTEGVRWLRALHDLGLGACLADDMGLGKTLQVITLLAWLKSEAAAARRAAEPTLLVAPASLLANWRAEVAKFAPDLRVGVAHPSGGEEEGLDEKRGPAWASARDLVVTTYGQVPRLAWLSKQSWRLVVLDEAQAIKNAGTKQTRRSRPCAAACASPSPAPRWRTGWATCGRSSISSTPACWAANASSPSTPERCARRRPPTTRRCGGWCGRTSCGA